MNCQHKYKCRSFWWEKFINRFIWNG